MTPEIDTYLDELRLDLIGRGAFEAAFIEEARDHLTDAFQEGLERGLPRAAAASQALARFGEVREVAAAYAEAKHHGVDRRLLLLAGLAGAAIAYMDSRPHWDDAGVTAFSMLLAAAACGAAAPRRPWRWAIAIGLWIPALALLHGGFPQSLLMTALLAFPAAGAYAGAAIRRGLAHA
jgi:hypothetical protein